MSKFDINSLRMDEVQIVEELSGLPIDALSDGSSPKGKALAALVFVAKRRDNPEYTYNDACGVTLTDALKLVGPATEEVAVDPDDPIAVAEAGADSPKGARKR